jgi:hypothetical protein
MHPSQQELLDLRDGEGTAETERHLQSCVRCAREVDELRVAADALRDLPCFSPEEDLWPRVEGALLDRRRRKTRLIVGAVAAALVVAATSLVAVRLGSRGESIARVSPADLGMAVEQLQVASSELESMLQSPSLRAPVLSPQRAALIVEIEDRIAVVDLALSRNEPEFAGPRAVALWSDRVELLDALVVVRSGDRRDERYRYATFDEERSYR